MPSDKMDGTDKAAVGCAIFALVAISVCLGTAVWAFIQLVQWITTK